MKKIINILLISCVLVVASCTKLYESYNTNPGAATEDQLGPDHTLLAISMRGMQKNIIPTQEHLYQFVELLIGSNGGYWADSKPWENSFALYNPTQDWLEKPYETIVETYQNYFKVKKYSDDPVIHAIADITRVSAMSRLSDIYGPMSFSDLGEGKLTATYDSQERLYEECFTVLNSAITELYNNRTASISSNIDLLFGGDPVKWLKYANSLKLRLAMRLSYSDATLAQKMAEEAVAHEIGLMESNADNAFVSVLIHPLTLVVGDWKDTRIAADLTSYMNGYEDPRRAQYFTKSTLPDVVNGYHGFRRGITGFNKDAVAAKYASINAEKVVTDKGVMVMNAAEIAFLKAEGALRGWNMGGTARDFYQRGITLSFEQWGAGNASSYIANDINIPQSYKDPLGNYNNDGPVSTATIAWSEGDDMEQKLERIITQKWIANFPLSIEAWSEHRRTGYPILMKAPMNLSGGIVSDVRGVRRLPYPQKEYRENGENLATAVSMLGGPDNMATDIWWDSKNK